MPADTYTNEGIQTHTEFLNEFAGCSRSRQVTSRNQSFASTLVAKPEFGFATKAVFPPHFFTAAT